MSGSFNCSDPVSVTNGYYLFDKSTYGDGDQVYFICYDGYSMNGSPLLTCDGATGNWTGNPPICSSTTTTLTTTTAATQEWMYVSVGLISFLGLLILLISFLVCILLCYKLCRQKSKVTALRGNEERLRGIEERLDVGCCYTCCTRCCLRCCRCCHDDHPNVSPQPPLTSSSPTSVFLEDRSMSTTKTFLKEVKPAKEIAEWKPFSNPLRKINTSTK
ncbi:uncharacterized protein LOC111110374 [Crassostrea virginica]